MANPQGHTSFRRARTLCRAVMLVLLMPFLAASLIGPHTMPVTDAQGRVTMVLCGSDVPVQMIVAADGTLTPADAAGGEHRTCVWAAHGQPVLDVLASYLPAPSWIGVASGLAPAQAVQVSFPDLPAPVARGPPSSA